MDGFDVEIRSVDGSGWARAVGDAATQAASWVAEHALAVTVVVVALLAMWVLWRALTRGRISRS